MKLLLVDTMYVAFHYVRVDVCGWNFDGLKKGEEEEIGTGTLFLLYLEQMSSDI